MLLKPANLLLLDEPTSHLDIASRNVLEMALKQFQGAICLITHDRHLINQIASKVIEIDQGTPNVYLGNYDDYFYKKQQAAGVKKEIKVEIEKKDKSIKKKSKFMVKEERQKRAQEINQFRKQLSGLEKRFEEAEKLLQGATQKLDHLNQKLSDPNLYLNQKETYDTVQAHKQTREEVKQLTQLWEFLALELEELKMMDIMSNANE
jgi:ATP-binding cassette subfamily F protein 3